MNTFAHVNLFEVDPTSTGVPEGRYNLQIASMKLVEYTSKEGELKERISIAFVITDDENHSGRRFYVTLWPDNRGLVALRRIMDATGIPQEGSFQEWLDTISTTNPVINAKVTVRKYTSASGEAGESNEVDWRTISPAVNPF